MLGAIAIKKKLRRIRQAKQNEPESMVDTDETKLPETDAVDEVSKEENNQ